MVVLGLEVCNILSCSLLSVIIEMFYLYFVNWFGLNCVVLMLMKMDVLVRVCCMFIIVYCLWFVLVFFVVFCLDWWYWGLSVLVC